MKTGSSQKQTQTKMEKEVDASFAEPQAKQKAEPELKPENVVNEESQSQSEPSLLRVDCQCVVCCSDMNVPAYQPDATDSASDGSDSDSNSNSNSNSKQKHKHKQIIQKSGRKATYTLKCGHTFHASCII